MIKTRLVKLLSHARIYVILQVVCQWFALLAQITIIYASATLLEGALSGRLDRGFVIIRAVMIAVSIALRFFFERLGVRNSYLASVDVKRILREKIYGKLLRLGASYREDVATSEVVQMSGEGVEQLETYFGRYLPQLFYSLLAPVTLFVILSFVNVKASVILLICVPLIPVSIVVVQKIAKRLLNKYWGIYTELGDSFLENLQGLSTLKIYQADEQKAKEMDEESQRFRRITMKVLTMQLNSTSVMDIIAYGGAAIGMVVVILEYLRGNVSLAGTLMIVLLASEFFIPLRLLGSFFHIAMNGMAVSDRIFAFLDLPEPKKKEGKLSEGPVDIRMRDVRFSYQNTDQPQNPDKNKKVNNSGDRAKNAEKLDSDRTGFQIEAEAREILGGIDLSLPAGNLVSIVGASGCGKSTIAQLLAGRNRGYKGSILVQGQELSELSGEGLASHITLIAHNSYLFKGSVRENLLMGKPDATDEELTAVLSDVNLLVFLETQKGLDTELLERGSNLSGGQCQRLSLARALLHNTPVYIFDEATSNIDVESEAAIMRVIRQLAKTKTVLLISHRLANVVGSDHIYMLEGGKITEQGTHEELLQKDGAYSRLYHYQKELEGYAGDLEPDAKETQTFAGDRGVDANGTAAYTADRTLIGAAKQEENSAATQGTKDSKGAAETAQLAASRRSGLAIIGKLIGLVKPLLPVMLLAIALGVIGYLCAISLTILSGHGIIHALFEQWGMEGTSAGGLAGLPLGTLFTMLIIFAIARGFLHYGEQYCNHFIAFKLLAIIRHKVFTALRKLCPAKLEGRDRGNLISIITSDIELLEVFYAHTISPVAIAVVICIVMIVLIGNQYLPAALIALAGYIVVGALIPLWNGKRSADAGMNFREGFGDLNSYILDSLRGLDETIQYGRGEERLAAITERSAALGKLQERLNRREMLQRPLTGLAISAFSAAMLFFMLCAYLSGAVDFQGMLIAVIAMMGSFGPVAALSSLSNTLSQTLASGERVLRLLEEAPQVEEVSGLESTTFAGAAVEDVYFSYGAEMILADVSLAIPKGTILGIHGASGSGKSTLLKLLMRFWDVQDGAVTISDKNIKKINTSDLRDMESYVTQETVLFHDTIANNIAIGKPGAERNEIIKAAKMAALDDFVQSLPEGYDTMVGELGDTLSGGEKQRIGLARAFLHDSPFLLLDEPTSNLDALNEGMIMKSISRSAKDKTVVLVSHRRSTLHLADTIVSMDQGRAS